MSDEQDVLDSVEKAKAPGAFKILDAISGRGYPEQTVTVYLDEATAYEAALVKEELDQIDSKKSTPEIDAKRNELTEKQEELLENLTASAFTFHLRGVSEGKREEIYNQAKKKYPIEYETPFDISVLAGQKAERVEKESPERDTLFTELLWAETIQKIVDPEGNEQVGITYSEVKQMRQLLPLAASAAINSTVEKLRVSSAIFMSQVNEDFLAKP